MPPEQQFVWDKVEPQVFMSQEEWRKSLAGYEFIPFKRNGEIVGVVMFYPVTGEIHLSANCSGLLTRKFMKSLWARANGKLITKINNLDSISEKLVKRLGFELSIPDEFFSSYVMKDFRYA